MLGKTVGKFTKFKVTNCGSKVKWSNSCFEILKKGFGYFLKMNSKRVTNFKFTICSSKVKWSSFSFNILIKGFEIHFIKVANIQFLLPYNRSRVSIQGVESLWGDCSFFPADWRSQQQICAILLFLKTFHYKND